MIPAEENQKKYAADDERIKSSPIMKELLERSKKNKDKYNSYTITIYFFKDIPKKFSY